MTTITATELRANIYRLLDSVLETGIPLSVDRGGRKLVIQAVGVPATVLERLDAIPQRDWIVGDPENLNASWEWNEPALIAEIGPAFTAPTRPVSPKKQRAPRKPRA